MMERWERVLKTLKVAKPTERGSRPNSRPSQKAKIGLPGTDKNICGMLVLAALIALGEAIAPVEVAGVAGVVATWEVGRGIVYTWLSHGDHLLTSPSRIPMGDNDEHSATEPSKRERLPTMETYNVRKRKMISGAAGAMTERFGFPRKQVTNTVASLEARPAMTFTKPVPKSSATNHKIPESRTYGPADSLPK